MIKKSSTLFKRIEKLINTLDIQSISADRRTTLQPLIDIIQLKESQGAAIRLNFICTHNSRRSHLSQVWAQTMASYFNVDKVFCYSGGTETTALFPMIAATLKNSGFLVNTLSSGSNPVYSIKFSNNDHPIIGFSKTMDDDFNPKSEFVAIMTCDSANEACPFVPGAEQRIPVTFEDPKVYDHTPEQAKKYSERSLQIATEMLYVFSQIHV